MGQFPVLIFAGMAPIFALTDHAENSFFWNKLELAGTALFVGYFGAHLFRATGLVPSILQAIGVTITIAAYSYTRQALGPRIGKLPLILFFLAAEYLALKLYTGESAIFLADVIRGVQFVDGLRKTAA